MTTPNYFTFQMDTGLYLQGIKHNPYWITPGLEVNVTEVRVRNDSIGEPMVVFVAPYGFNTDFDGDECWKGSQEIE